VSAERIFLIAALAAAPISLLWLAADAYRARLDGLRFDRKTLRSIWWSHFWLILVVLAVALNFYFGA
jgi:hypothetical protein